MLLALWVIPHRGLCLKQQLDITTSQAYNATYLGAAFIKRRLVMRLRAFVILGLAILIALTAFPGQAQAATFVVTKTADISTAATVLTSTPVLAIQDIQGVAGETVTVDVVFSNPAGTGFSGIGWGMAIENPEIAEFVDVQLPDWIDPFIADFLMDFFIAPDGFPTSSIELVVPDLMEDLGGVLDDEVLATMSFRLISTGETTLVLDLFQLDSDGFSEPDFGNLIPITEYPDFVTIVGSSANLPPVAENDLYRVHQDNAIDTALDGLPGVLDNDDDPEDDDLTANLMNDVSNGTLTLNEDGSFVYTPNPGFSGEDSFVYVASDGLLTSNEATVVITVVPLCTLDMALDFADGTLTMNFDVGTAEPALWVTWLFILGFPAFPIWSEPLEAIDPPEHFEVSIPEFPSLGKVWFLTVLATSEGVTCFDAESVETGVSLSAIPSASELRNVMSWTGVALPNTDR